ncbi:hypothetical protein CDD83_3496 [Cordyceps sp. RAO-2017]|nr:hypothetical protein CDD83_3496 [Cordyceps sp. RAO-2017]
MASSLTPQAWYRVGLRGFMAQKSSISGLRSLLPAPLPPGPPPVRPSSSDLEAISKRTVVQAACESCRQRKIKCDGRRPSCAACGKLRRTCHYSTEPSESRAAALKRKHTEVVERLADHVDFIELLRTSSASGTREILSRIDAKHDVPSILQQVKDSNLLLQVRLAPKSTRNHAWGDAANAPRVFHDAQDPYEANLSAAETPEDPEASSAKSGPRNARIFPYHSAQLVDPRFGQVRASAWTQVTSDDVLVARLLAIYFQWDFPLLQFFHKDLFLDDLVAGRKRFCSSLLVNAILASASHGYTDEPDRARFWTPCSLTYAFMAESKRLWEAEALEERLTTVQTACIFSLRHMADGSDKIGWEYARRATAMADRLGLFRGWEPSDGEMSMARNVTAWGLFTWQSLCCSYLSKRPLVPEPPATPLPDSVVGEMCVHYPLGETPTPIFLSQCFRAHAELRVLVSDFAHLQHPQPYQPSHMSLEDAFRFRDELLAWFDNLPAELQPSNVALPHQIHIHIHYQLILINLFRPWASGAVCDGRGSGDPARVVQASQARLESLVRLYSSCHGLEGPDVTLPATLLILGSMALAKLTAESRARAEFGTLYLCARGLRHQGLNNHLGALAFQVLRDLVKPAEPHVQTEFARIEAETAGVEMRPEELASDWPLYRWIFLSDEGLGKPTRMAQCHTINSDEGAGGGYEEYEPVMEA